MEEELKNTGSSLQSLVDEAEADKQRELSVSTLEPQQEQVTRAVDQSQKETSLLQTPTTINPELEQPQEGKSALNKSIFATTPLAIPSAIGLGVVDFGIDVATKLTGQEQLDDKWDRITKFDNPWAQRLRNFFFSCYTYIYTCCWLGKICKCLKTTSINKCYGSYRWSRCY